MYVKYVLCLSFDSKMLPSFKRGNLLRSQKILKSQPEVKVSLKTHTTKRVGPQWFARCSHYSFFTSNTPTQRKELAHTDLQCFVIIFFSRRTPKPTRRLEQKVWFYQIVGTPPNRRAPPNRRDALASPPDFIWTTFLQNRRTIAVEPVELKLRYLYLE